jgi:hypothetical protein
MGLGFDPRMNLGAQAVIRAGGPGCRQVILLEFDEGSASPSLRYQPWIQTNLDGLASLVGGPNNIQRRRIRMWATDGRRISSRSAAEVFRRADEFSDFDDVILDVSSLPRSIFYALLAKLLHLVDNSPRPMNLFVLVAENPEMDKRIIDEGIDDDADYVHLFRSGAERMATAGEPKVWIPVLGERQYLQLQRIYDLIIPDEVCPVLPSPALNPRRPDDLIVEYQRLLFDGFRVEPRNFIYASERNPFEVYRQIRKTVMHYRRALMPLGGCRAVISSVSSKLLSIGALLAAYELKEAKLDIGIAHIESQGYRVEQEESIAALTSCSVLFGLWLSGECYD